MEKELPLSPAKAANQLNKITEIFCAAHGGNRFPIDVDQLALGCAEIFRWADPITEIEKADIQTLKEYFLRMRTKLNG